MQFRSRPKTNDNAQPVERLCVSANEAARMLDISPRKLHELTRTGELACKRVGRRVLYSVDVLKRFANGE